MLRLRGWSLLVLLAAAIANGQAPLTSLKTVPVPQPANLSRYVQEQAKLVLLGKALFWDMQLGSDARAACATCHFHAGADHRLQNMLSNPVGTFQPNYTLAAADFPFHVKSNPASNTSPATRDTSQRAASPGVFRRDFIDVVTGSPKERWADVLDTSGFSAGGVNVRQAGPRNTPSVINAVFYFKNLWDGRASPIFTGTTPFGLSDTRANVLSTAGGQLTAETIALDNSSLASQAVGPPLNTAEMSATGRNWPKLGKKILALRPLALQKIATNDGVLGASANPNGKGFAATTTYLDLVKAVFQPAYWNSTQLVDSTGKPITGAAAPANSAQYTQAEYNFAIFFGLAIQAYEATLVSDRSPFDLFAEGQTTAMTPQEQAGQREFGGEQCALCHSGAEFSAATVGEVNRVGPTGQAGLDTGFFRTNVRPAAEDVGLGGVDDFGKPFSTAVALGTSNLPRAAGVFKTPGLRNIEFTGPYMHNGGLATLEQVMDFYSRGGDFPEAPNRGRDLNAVNLNANERVVLIAFMKALTDDRVRFERAPFDHPELCVPVGHTSAPSGGLQAETGTLSAADKWAGIPAVGETGNTVPLQTFEELLLGVGADGTRAHHLGDACTVAEARAPITAAGLRNAASGGTAYAPGMALSVYGIEFAESVQQASSLPLPTALGGFSATVNGVSAPLYYVSAGQVNLQIPYETQPGTATLVLANSSQSVTHTFPVVAAAPGIFNVGDTLIPDASARRGQIISMYITGDGQVTPSLATGATPASSTPLTQLPKPRLPVTITVGGVEAVIQFIGIPSGLAGVTQVNFEIPAGAPLGVQSVVVTVGGAPSAPAKLTVTQ